MRDATVERRSVLDQVTNRHMLTGFNVFGAFSPLWRALPGNLDLS